MPDFVIVCLEIDDVAGCQLLSMLKVDRETSDIPVVTWVMRREANECNGIIADMTQDSSLEGLWT